MYVCMGYGSCANNVHARNRPFTYIAKKDNLN